MSHNAALEPTEWHRQPKDHHIGPCPICGCPPRTGNLRRFEHRATRADENLVARWIGRRRSGDGWQEISVLPTAPRPRPIKRPSRKSAPPPKPKRHGPTDETVARIRTATAMLATGGTPQQAAAVLGISCSCLRQLKTKHSDLWADAMNAAKQQADKVAPPPPIPPPDKAPRPVTPGEKVRQGIVKATAALATGATHGEAAAAADATLHAMRDWERSYPEYWTFAYDQAMETAVKILRDQAGTDAIFTDPARFLRIGNRCIKWTEARGELLFDAGKVTLQTFFASHFLPRRLGAVAHRTIEKYEEVLRRWALVTGDPPLSAVTDEVVCKFRDFSARVTNSPNSVRSALKHVQAVLDAAGPRGRRNRDGANILVDVPYARPPKEIFHAPRVWSLDQISDIYLATVAMEVPIAFGFKPPAWWKSLLVVAYCTALRRRALVSICMADILWRERSLIVRPEYTKTGRGVILPLPDVAIEHLRSIRTDRHRVFEWPHNSSHLHTCFRRLVSAAGVTSHGKVGLHTMRRSVATVLFQRDPAAAQLLLGHSNVTIKHYVQSDKILRQAIDALPMPAAFTLPPPTNEKAIELLPPTNETEHAA